MRVIKNILYTGVVLLGLTSCKKNFLDRSLGTLLPEEKVFSSEVLAQQYADNAYTFMVNDYMRFDDHRGSSAQASDEAISGKNENSVRTLNQGVYHEHATTPAVNDITNVYNNSYAGIRYCNQMLAKSKDVPWVTPGLKNRIEGEMHFLRAFFYFELIKRFGGVVIYDHVYDENEDVDLPRNTYQECLNFILSDLLISDDLLPDQSGYTVGQYGRATKGASKALRSRVLLFAASQLNNPTNDLTKWASAAKAAKDVMDLQAYSLQTTYTDLLNVPQSPEYIMIKIRGPRAISNWIDGIMSPGRGGSVGQLNPTQNHVDLYEMKTTGRPITDALSGYNAANPYLNRDPRLDANVLYNQAIWQSAPMQIWTQTSAAGVITYGADYRPSNPSYTATGYYSRKMWPEAFKAGFTGTALLNYVYFRYAEILLNYAEAQNEAVGPDASVLDAINQIRTRVGMPVLQTTLPLGNGYVAPNKDAMRARIRNERAVELAFEDFRWYDIMRWDIGPDVIDKSKNPGYGMNVIKNLIGTYTYTKTLLPDNFQKIYAPYMHLYPIPRVEVNKSKGILKQNPGWE